MSGGQETLHRLAKVFRFLGILVWVAWWVLPLTYYNHLVRDSPTAPNATNSVAMGRHGNNVYITPTENVTLTTLIIGGGILLLACALTGHFLKTKAMGQNANKITGANAG